MSGIFISYRRGDSEGQARALSIELASYVGANRVFMDVDSIALGRDFRQSLQESLVSCDAVLVLIGPEWLDVRDGAGKRRLDNPADFVRQEVATALGRNIPVTPVLVRGAQMPDEAHLPDDLKALAFRNGFELSHTRWHSDVRELAERLALGAAVAASSPGPLTAKHEASPKELSWSAPSPQPPGQAEAAGQKQRAALWLTRRRALGASAVALVAAAAVSFPYVRRLGSKAAKPTLRTSAFEFATVDERGARLPAEKATASTFTESLAPDVGLEMVLIPGGAFMMGSPKYEWERRPNEGPQHTVTFAHSFFIGASPVSQAQWAAVVAAHPGKISYGLDPFPSFFKGGDLPVETISWNEADEFCRRLAEVTERDYRLPSEAEWEYACRAGSSGPFNTGPTITTDLANYCGEGGAVCGDNDGKSIAASVYDDVTYGTGAYDQGPSGGFRGTTTPRGAFPPNRFGLYDMHGNVWEYCLDLASPTYLDAPTDGAASLAGSPGGKRILRGGSWSHNPAICRSAYRDMIAPDNPGWQGRIGLRVVCAA